jgi:hypothetical protein
MSAKSPSADHRIAGDAPAKPSRDKNRPKPPSGWPQPGWPEPEAITVAQAHAAYGPSVAYWWARIKDGRIKVWRPSVRRTLLIHSSVKEHLRGPAESVKPPSAPDQSPVKRRGQPPKRITAATNKPAKAIPDCLADCTSNVTA